MSTRRVAPSTIRPGDEVELHTRSRGVLTIRRIVVEDLRGGMLCAVGGGMLDPESDGEWFLLSSPVSDVVTLAETLSEVMEVASALDDPRSTQATKDACRLRLDAMSSTVVNILSSLPR